MEFSAVRASASESRICSFPDEPLVRDRWVFFVRKADVGRLEFSSFDDLVGHEVGVPGTVPGLFETIDRTTRPVESSCVSITEHGQEMNGALQGLQMLAAGRIDYAFANLPDRDAERRRNGIIWEGRTAVVPKRDGRRDNMFALARRGDFFLFRRCFLACVEAVQANRRIPGDIPQIFSVKTPDFEPAAYRPGFRELGLRTSAIRTSSA